MHYDDLADGLTDAQRHYQRASFARLFGFGSLHFFLNYCARTFLFDFWRTFMRRGMYTCAWTTMCSGTLPSDVSCA